MHTVCTLPVEQTPTHFASAPGVSPPRFFLACRAHWLPTPQFCRNCRSNNHNQPGNAKPANCSEPRQACSILYQPATRLPTSSICESNSKKSCSCCSCNPFALRCVPTRPNAPLPFSINNRPADSSESRLIDRYVPVSASHDLLPALLLLQSLPPRSPSTALDRPPLAGSRYGCCCLVRCRTKKANSKSEQ